MNTLGEALGALREAPRWFLYLLTWDSTAAKYAKEPCALDGSRRPIDASKPENWNTYAAARAALEALPRTPERCYTLGFWLTADCGYWFFDLDKVSPGDGSLTEHAQAMVRMFPGALLEWSSSLRGLHIIGRTAGGIPPHRNRAIDGLSYEFYSAGRGIAFGLSGQATGSADTCHDVSVHQVVSSYFPKQETVAAGAAAEWNGPQDDDELIRRMLAARPSAEAVFGRKVTLRQLWDGQCDKNSEHDMALASHLAFWTGRNAERIARLMWRSGLVREKWRTHRTYVQTTIQNACARCANVYQETRPLPAGPVPATNVRNGASLMQRSFAPVQWALHGLIPQGTEILSAPPKSGKSWLVLQACIAVAAGVPLWSGRDAETQGDTLYLDLEGADRRLQERIAGLLHAFPRGISLDRFFYETDWPRAEAGVAKLREWLSEHPGARMVVIDTLASFRDPDPGRKSAYMADYQVGEMLKPLVREFPVAIVIVTHSRKMGASDAMDRISGTQGLVGGVDNYMVLSRANGNMDAELIVNGRDIREPLELALRKLKEGGWVCVGNSADIKRSDERNDVLKALASLGGVGTPRDIHSAMDAPVALQTLYKRLGRMVEAGEILKSGKLYTLLSKKDHELKPPPIPQAVI